MSSFLLNLLGAGGTGRNVITETIETFRPNAEKSEERAALHATAALAQYAAEFHNRENRTWLDAFADGLNRLVRPVVTIGLLFPIPATVWAPEQMATVWRAVATLPTGYWAVMGLVLPFYFGGRMQVKALASSSWLAAAAAATALDRTAGHPIDENAAIRDWQDARGG